jgi:Lar family restriction alleviation protein
MDALKKCPRCGSKKVRLESFRHNGTEYLAVRCEKCACQTSYYASHHGAVTAWNRRAVRGAKCGNCVFLEKEDGLPYCVTLPLYTERDPEHTACEYFVDGRADDDTGRSN